MTQDELIKLARQAAGSNLASNSPYKIFDSHNELFAFAKLIAEKEREKILAVLRRKPDQQIYKVLDEIRGMK